MAELTQTDTITTNHPWSIVDYIIAYSIATPSTAIVWPVANTAFFIPLYLPETVTSVRIFWNNGSVASGNVDAGIYSESGTRLASTGSTAQSGTVAPQSVALGTTLVKGTYYLALAMDNVTGRMERFTASNLGLAKATGVCEMASAFPLPASATFATLASNFIPVMGLTVRSGSVL